MDALRHCNHSWHIWHGTILLNRVTDTNGKVKICLFSLAAMLLIYVSCMCFKCIYLFIYLDILLVLIFESILLFPDTTLIVSNYQRHTGTVEQDKMSTGHQGAPGAGPRDLLLETKPALPHISTSWTISQMSNTPRPVGSLRVQRKPHDMSSTMHPSGVLNSNLFPMAEE